MNTERLAERETLLYRLGSELSRTVLNSVIYSALLSLAFSLTLIYNPKLNPPYIQLSRIETPNSKTILSRASAPRPVCLAPRPCLGTKAVPWHQGRPSITVIRPQKALQLETLFGGLGGTPSRRRQTLTTDFKTEFGSSG